MLRHTFLLRRCSSSLQIVLAWSMVLGPLPMVQAQPPADAPATENPPDDAPESPKTYVTPQSFAVAHLRPRQLLTAEGAEMLPTEVFAAAGLQYLGIDPAEISKVTAIVEPPLGANLFYALVLDLERNFQLENLPEPLRAHATAAERDGKFCWQSEHPSAPSFFMPNDRQLIVASPMMLDKLLKARQKGDEPSALMRRLANRSEGNELYLTVDIKALRPMIQLGLWQAAKEVPPEGRPLLEAPSYVDSAELTVNLFSKGVNEFVFHANNVEDAEKLEELIEYGVSLAQAQMRAEMADEIARMQESDDPVERAMASYIERMSGTVEQAYRPLRNEATFTVFRLEAGDSDPMVAVAAVGVLTALLLPAVQAAREAARRNAAVNSMKQLELAMLNHEAVHGELPAHATYDEQGRPLLSWRVQLLPYLEQQELYNRFHHDEPWDSAHNKALIPLMPEIFCDPSSALQASEGKTHFVVPVGEGFAFEKSPEGTKLRRFTDGLSNTFNLLQVDDEHAVIWTKPDDWTLDRQQPLRGLGGLHPGIFLAGWADGSVVAVPLDIDADRFQAMLTRAGGEQVEGL